jgi:hypothetical protein
VVIKTLNVTVYNQSGSAWWTELTSNPEWPEIEVAILRLDQYCYPFVWLHRDGIVEEDSLPDFTIIGGNGAYVMDGRIGTSTFQYIQADASDEIVRVWQSDQGFEIEKKYICFDISRVLYAANYFCEHGTAAPAVTWDWGSTL